MSGRSRTPSSAVRAEAADGAPVAQPPLQEVDELEEVEEEWLLDDPRGSDQGLLADGRLAPQHLTRRGSLHHQLGEGVQARVQRQELGEHLAEQQQVALVVEVRLVDLHRQLGAAHRGAAIERLAPPRADALDALDAPLVGRRSRRRRASGSPAAGRPRPSRGSSVPCAR